MWFRNELSSLAEVSLYTVCKIIFCPTDVHRKSSARIIRTIQMHSSKIRFISVLKNKWWPHWKFQTWSKRLKLTCIIVQRHSPYRAVNKLDIGYKNQSVNALQWKKPLLLLRSVHNSTRCGQKVSFTFYFISMLNQVVTIVTTWL